MSSISSQAQLYVVTAFTFQIVLLVHFMLRKWAFGSYIYQFG